MKIDQSMTVMNNCQSGFKILFCAKSLLVALSTMYDTTNHILGHMYCCISVRTNVCHVYKKYSKVCTFSICYERITESKIDSQDTIFRGIQLPSSEFESDDVPSLVTSTDL